MIRSLVALAGMLACVFGGATPCSAAEPRPPKGRTPAVIDYEKPAQYARIPKSAGDVALIRKLATSLQAKKPEHTFLNIHAFLRSKVPHVPEDGWRADPWNFDRLVRGFDHRGCASHGLVFANLARACGIPVVYIKSSRHAWIREYVASGKTGSFAGHVFLEVYVDGRWQLLDAQGMRIWDRYDPRDLELPGGLRAYEKGWDHHAMVHSTRRDEYIREAKARWKGFDVTTLRRNENPGRSLVPKAYAVTLGDEWKVLSQRLGSLHSFDLGYWPRTIDKVKGRMFVVTSMGGRVEVPPDEIDAWLPVGLEQLEKEFLAGASHVRTRLKADGTLVVLVSAPGLRELMRLLWATDFEAMRAAHAAR